MLTIGQKDKIKESICTTLQVEESEINETTNLEKDLGADSFDQVEILLDVEKKFSIRISDDEFVKVKTFGELCDAVEKQLVKDEKK